MTRSNLSTIPAGIAWGTSVLFSPFLVPIATAVGVVQKYADPQDALRWLVIVVVFVTVLPALSIGLMVRYAKVSDFHLQNREERLLPLCCTLISMIVGTVLLHQLGAAREIVWAGVAYVANSVIFSAITPIWKISFHSSVATGCVTVLVMLVNPQFGWLFLVGSVDFMGAGLPKTSHASPNCCRRSTCCQYHGNCSVYGTTWQSNLK